MTCSSSPTSATCRAARTTAKSSKRASSRTSIAGSRAAAKPTQLLAEIRRAAPLAGSGPMVARNRLVVPLDLADVRGRGAFLPLRDLELHRFAFLEGAESLGLDCRVMHEDVLATVLGREETVPLRVVEPLHLPPGHIHSTSRKHETPPDGATPPTAPQTLYPVRGCPMERVILLDISSRCPDPPEKFMQPPVAPPP